MGTTSEDIWGADTSSAWGTYDNLDDWLASIQYRLLLSPANMPFLASVLRINIRVVGDTPFEATILDGGPSRPTLTL